MYDTSRACVFSINTHAYALRDDLSLFGFAQLTKDASSNTAGLRFENKPTDTVCSIIFVNSDQQICAKYWGGWFTQVWIAQGKLDVIVHLVFGRKSRFEIQKCGLLVKPNLQFTRFNWDVTLSHSSKTDYLRNSAILDEARAWEAFRAMDSEIHEDDRYLTQFKQFQVKYKEILWPAFILGSQIYGFWLRMTPKLSSLKW